MSKGLQALEKIKRFEIFGTPLVHHNLFGEELNIIEKSLIALEIIKKKEIDVGELVDAFKDNMLLEEYNFYIARIDLTLEEYDLLKEVLGDKHA